MINRPSRRRTLAAAVLLLAGGLAAASAATPPAPDARRPVRLLAPAPEPKPEARSLATQVSILLGLGAAAVLVWRFSRSAPPRRRRFWRLGRRSRLGRGSGAGENPFDDLP